MEVDTEESQQGVHSGQESHQEVPSTSSPNAILYEEKHLPYVSVTVKELTAVSSLEHWANVKVRVIGKFLPTESNVMVLQSVEYTNNEPYYLNLDLCAVEHYPKYGMAVQAFGKLYIKDHCSQEPNISKVTLAVKFFRSVEQFNIPIYIEVLSKMKEFVPEFT